MANHSVNITSFMAICIAWLVIVILERKLVNTLWGEWGLYINATLLDRYLVDFDQAKNYMENLIAEYVSILIIS